jgi:hypothetical protein
MRHNTMLEHPAEEALERFVLHQSSEDEIEAVETHFMACESCIERLEEVELQISATKLALQQLHLERVAESVAKTKARPHWFSIPGLSIAGALATLAIALSVVPAIHREKSAAVDIELTAYRGLESPVLPKDHNLHVRLNANGLEINPAKVTLVNSDGIELWNGQAEIRDHFATVYVPQIHSTGAHFFRICAPGQNSDPVREFSVDVE